PNGFLSAEHMHLVTEWAKLAFADREAWYADPDFARVPLAELLSREYAETRRRLVGERASVELRPGSPLGTKPCLPRRDSQLVSPGLCTGTVSQSLRTVRCAT